MLEERSVQTNDYCTRHANAQTANVEDSCSNMDGCRHGGACLGKEGVVVSQDQTDKDAQFLFRVLLWIVGVVTVGALIAAAVL